MSRDLLYRIIKISVPITFSAIGATNSLAQQSESNQSNDVIEQVVVTGTFIRGSSTTAPSPVQVIDRASFESQGAATIWDVVKNMEINQGSTTNQNSQDENDTISGTANVNLRNLGQNSTLTLINGKRQVVAAALTRDGSEFVDLNTIPQVMLERVEILTDGGSALYGSDAIAGVVNLIMRTDFEGFELYGDIQQIEGAGSRFDQTASAIWGWSSDDQSTNLVLAGEYFERDPVPITEASYFDPEKTEFYGEVWKTFAAFGKNVNPAYINAENFSRSSSALGEFTDPLCEELGFFVSTPENPLKREEADDPISDCLEDTTEFQFINVGQQRHSLSASLSHLFNENVEFYSFGMYSKNEIERADSGNIGSLGPAVALPSGDPVKGLGSRAFVIGQQQPIIGNAPHDLANGGFNEVTLLQYQTNIPRPGGSTARTNEDETYGIQLGLKGEFEVNDKLFDFDVSYSRSHNERLRLDRTIVRDRAELAINGLGGPNCVPNGISDYNLDNDPYFGFPAVNDNIFNEYTPGYPQNLRETISLAVTSTNHGKDGCLFLNPNLTQFTNPELANDPTLIDWLTPIVPVSDRENTFEVFDLVVSGELGQLGHRSVGFALGYQHREQRQLGRSYELVEPGLQTIASYDPITTRYASNDNRFGGFFTNSFDDTRKIDSLFGELQVPLSPTITSQFALRWEDYGGSIGDEVSPKIALLWDVSDSLSLRTSFSESFRAPNTGIIHNGIGGLVTQTSVRDSLSVKSVRAGLVDPTFENSIDDRLYIRGRPSPDLKSETARTYNFGILWEGDIGPMEGLNASIDFWRFEFEDRVVTQPLRAALEPELQNFLQARQDPSNYVLFDSIPTRADPRNVPCNPNELAAQYGSDSQERLNCVVNPVAYRTPGVDRGQTGNIITLDVRSVNSGKIATDGLDIKLAYNLDTKIGNFDFLTSYTHVRQYTVSDLLGFERGFFSTGVTDAAGTSGDGVIARSTPDNKGTISVTWSSGNHSVTSNTRFIGSYTDLAYGSTVANATDRRIALAERKIRSYNAFDLQYNYNASWSDFSTTRFTLGVLDAFEESITHREWSDLNYDATVFDPRGRRMYFRVLHSF